MWWPMVVPVGDFAARRARGKGRGVATDEEECGASRIPSPGVEDFRAWFVAGEGPSSKVEHDLMICEIHALRIGFQADREAALGAKRQRARDAERARRASRLSHGLRHRQQRAGEYPKRKENNSLYHQHEYGTQFDRFAFGGQASYEAVTARARQKPVGAKFGANVPLCVSQLFARIT